MPRTAISTVCGVGSCDARFTPESARATEQVLKQGLSKIVKLQKQMLKLSKGKKTPAKLKKLKNLENQIKSAKLNLNNQIGDLSSQYNLSSADLKMISDIQSNTLRANQFSAKRLSQSRSASKAFRTSSSSVTSSAGRSVVSVLANGAVQVAITAAVVKTMEKNDPVSPR